MVPLILWRHFYFVLFLLRKKKKKKKKKKEKKEKIIFRDEFRCTPCGILMLALHQNSNSRTLVVLVLVISDSAQSLDEVVAVVVSFFIRRLKQQAAPFEYILLFLFDSHRVSHTNYLLLLEY